MPFLGLVLLMAVVTAPDLVRVGPGAWRPLGAKQPVEVSAFLLEPTAVTNAAFLAFVRTHPAWRRDRVAKAFADEAYLTHWQGPEMLGLRVDPEQPVTRVSWFAARAFCADRGRRLPTQQEWELAAQADATRTDASNDPAFRQRILDWYARPAGARLPRVGAGPANRWGARDLHGVIWEWVLDFTAARLATGVREGLACGAGTATARDKPDTATLLRYAFRSSLQARYTTALLGFRCAMDVPVVPARTR
jgi:sulfatase modifying factor 1